MIVVECVPPVVFNSATIASADERPDRARRTAGCDNYSENYSGTFSPSSYNLNLASDQDPWPLRLVCCFGVARIFKRESDLRVLPIKSNKMKIEELT